MVCLAMLPPEPGWIVSYTRCRCAHAAGREEEYKEEAEDETLFHLVPHMQKRQCCEQERGIRSGKGWQREQGVTEKAQWVSHCQFSALSPAKLPPSPATHSSNPHEVPWSKGPAGCGVIGAAFKAAQNQNTVMKWEFLCQVPSKPERLL